MTKGSWYLQNQFKLNNENNENVFFKNIFTEDNERNLVKSNSRRYKIARSKVKKRQMPVHLNL